MVTMANNKMAKIGYIIITILVASNHVALGEYSKWNCEAWKTKWGRGDKVKCGDPGMAILFAIFILLLFLIRSILVFRLIRIFKPNR